MKKVLVLLLSLVLVVGCLASFAACANNDKYDLTVGAIYIGGQDETTGYTAAHANGIKKAIANLETEGYKVNFAVVDNVAEDYNDVAAACDTLAGKGCDIIFGISFGYLNAMDDKAKEYPNVVFSHATGYLSNDTNYNNYFGRIYQARYLSGIAAGLKSLTIEATESVDPNSIGYVSAWGLEYAETTSGINAFALGVQSANPNATVYVKTINTWGDTTLEKQGAEYLINTHKCSVISQHCDSAQPQIVAQEKGVFGCGYNTDMTSDAPQAHLTAPIWNWHVYYQEAMQAVITDASTYMTTVGNYYGGLKENFVDISPLSANCTDKTAIIIENVKNLIIAGDWDVFTGEKLSYNLETGEIVRTSAAIGTLVTAEKEADNFVCGANDKTPDYVITGTMNTWVAGVDGPEAVKKDAE